MDRLTEHGLNTTRIKNEVRITRMSEHYDTDEAQLERPERATMATRPALVSAPSVSVTRRRPKTEKELYAEATERAKSLKEKLLTRRSQNRDRLIEDLYRKFGVVALDGDLDEADRLGELRSLLNQRLGLNRQEQQ